MHLFFRAMMIRPITYVAIVMSGGLLGASIKMYLWIPNREPHVSLLEAQMLVATLVLALLVMLALPLLAAFSAVQFYRDIYPRMAAVGIARYTALAGKGTGCSHTAYRLAVQDIKNASGVARASPAS